METGSGRLVCGVHDLWMASVSRPRKEGTGLSKAPSLIPKARQSEIVSDQVAAFLARGGQVTVIEPGETGIKTERPKSRERGNALSVRSRKGGARFREQSYRERVERKGLDTT